MPTVNVKRGDTLALDCTRTDSAGSAVSLAGVSIAAKMRRGSTEITLTASATDEAAGEFRLSALATTTDDWVLGVYDCDVEFTNGATVASSQTFQVNVVEDVTF